MIVVGIGGQSQSDERSVDQTRAGAATELRGAGKRNVADLRCLGQWEN